MTASALRHGMRKRKKNLTYPYDNGPLLEERYTETELETSGVLPRDPGGKKHHKHPDNGKDPGNDKGNNGNGMGNGGPSDQSEEGGNQSPSPLPPSPQQLSTSSPPLASHPAPTPSGGSNAGASDGSVANSGSSSNDSSSISSSPSSGDRTESADTNMGLGPTSDGSANASPTLAPTKSGSPAGKSSEILLAPEIKNFTMQKPQPSHLLYQQSLILFNHLKLEQCPLSVLLSLPIRRLVTLIRLPAMQTPPFLPRQYPIPKLTWANHPIVEP